MEENLLPTPLSVKLFEEVSEAFGIPSSYMEILIIRVHLFAQFPQGYHKHYLKAQGEHEVPYLVRPRLILNIRMCVSEHT